MEALTRSLHRLAFEESVNKKRKGKTSTNPSPDSSLRYAPFRVTVQTGKFKHTVTLIPLFAGEACLSGRQESGKRKTKY